MRADKAFFEALRAEVSSTPAIRSGELFDGCGGLDLNKKNLKECFEQSQQSFGQALLQQKDDEIAELKEKIEGLQSQVTIMEKANDELVNRNKKLQSVLDYYENPPLPTDFEEDIGKPFEGPFDTILTIPAITNYARNACDLADAKAIKMMLRELVRNPSKDDEEAISGILEDFIEPQKKPTQIKVERRYENGSQHNDHSKNLMVNSNDLEASKLLE